MANNLEHNTYTPQPNRRKFVLDYEAIEDLDGEYVGFCRECGTEHDGIEPDACNYTCEQCGSQSVYGAEQFAVMGWVR